MWTVRLADFVDGVYLPHVSAKRRPSTVRGYNQMWERYLKPRCTNLVMHDAETRMIQELLDEVAPQTLAHIRHLLSGIF
jgi:hypothetical protein